MLIESEKIRTWIEQRKKEHQLAYKEFHDERFIIDESEDDKILSFIESLEQEPKKGLHSNSLRKVDNPMAWIEEDEAERNTPKIKGWVARDDDNTLCVFSIKPERVFSDALSRHYWHPTLGRMPIKRWFFFGLKPEDEPIEVELTIRKV